MNRELASIIIAVMIIGGFMLLMVVILTGFVQVESPEIAKLVGALFGYLTGVMTPIIMRYFKDHTPPEAKL